MQNQFSRTERLLGADGITKLKHSRIIVFGIGGVGGYAVEALVRSGLGSIDLVDSDTICPSNLNRQIFALRSTIGMHKTDAARDRILDINPDVDVQVHRCFYLPETADRFDLSKYDYVLDCVDTVTAKIEIILRAQAAGVPVISCMGAGNKLDPTKFTVADIYRTTTDPLARVMRRELKKRGVRRLKVVYSTELPRTPVDAGGDEEEERRIAPGSTAFVPSAAGLILAGEVICDLTGIRPDDA